MSASKTLEGKAAALARRRATTRRRPTTELRRDLEEVAKRIRYGGEPGEGYREDLEAVRWLLSIAADFIQETPADVETVAKLKAVHYDLVNVWHELRERPRQERLRTEGAAILRSILDGPEPTE